MKLIESKDDRNKTLSIEEYFIKIRPYISNMIDDLKTQGKQEIDLSI